MNGEEIRKAVREHYGAAAKKVTEGKTGCCGTAADACCDPVSGDLYGAAETKGLPADAVAASLGCGNPILLADLAPGETVLDLGSGGGIDVLLSARRVGPTGKAIGLDMTDEMLELARKNAAEAGATNVEFRKGEMEAIPLPDASVDVILSNCVVNLSADKDRVLAEAFRVLRPGGRFAVSDIVVRGEVPEPILRSLGLWCGCVAGALREEEYAEGLRRAGFVDVSLETTRVYRLEDARAMLASAGIRAEDVDPALDGAFRAAFVRARKPLATQ